MRWGLYPKVSESEHANAWLRMQHLQRLAPKTAEAYGRSLEDYLAFCEREDPEPENAGRDDIASPNPGATSAIRCR